MTHKFTLRRSIAAFLLVCSILSGSVYANETKEDNIRIETERNESISSFVIARTIIENATDKYNNGDFAGSKQELDIAIEWLDKALQNSKTAKSAKESQILSDEIDNLKSQLNQSTSENENSLIRFLHKTTALIEREVDQLVHSYINLSNSESTLKHLLDAKLHLSYAKNDLLVNHKVDHASAELDKVIGYLDKANEIAIDPIKSRVSLLKNDISSLKGKIEQGDDVWKSDDEIVFLRAAIENLNKAKEIAKPNAKTQLASTISELQLLRKKIESASINNSYDSYMSALKDIINAL